MPLGAGIRSVQTVPPPGSTIDEVLKRDGLTRLVRHLQIIKPNAEIEMTFGIDESILEEIENVIRPLSESDIETKSARH
jgi:hypothetical protein